PVDTRASWPEHELITLAGLLSEGNTCHPTCLYFFGNERTLVDDFARAAGAFPESVARTTTRGDGRHEVCVSTGRDTRFQPGMTPWNARIASSTALARAAAPATRSGAFRWA